MAPAQQKKRVLKPKSGESKYVGVEPTWEGEFESDKDRRLALILALNWYNYNHDAKEARQCLVDWLESKNRKQDAKSVRNGPSSSFVLSAGWLSRMATRGFVLNDHEISVIERVVSSAKEKKQKDEESPDTGTKKPNIQDRLKEIALEAGGDIEGMFDEMIENGARMDKKYKPLEVLQSHNVVPQQISLIRNHWEKVLNELQMVQSAKDKELLEGYSNFGKIDIRNMVKFSEQVIADCNSYVQIKKNSRAPRKKKAVSPEKRVAKFKYLKEFDELKIKSVPPTKLVDATEAWLYDTKKRKLIHVVPDPLIKSFTVKGSSIVGFDPKGTCQKTLRKPKEQLSEFKKCSVPKARKWFKDIKATEIKFNGRGNDNLILLSVR